MAILSVAACCAPALCKEKNTEEKAAEVELFDAIDKGLVEVKMRQNGALEGNISVKNVSGQPLEIDMPAAFAAVPVAQFGMGGPGMGAPGMQGMGAPGMGGFGGMQGIGGGPQNRGFGLNDGQRGRMGLGDQNRGRSSMGGSGGGNQSTGGSFGGSRGGRGGGWFIAPEKTVREKVRTICLEHGKNDPYGGQEYALVPFDFVSENKTTRALVEMLGDDTVDQQALQAAVWNQECEVSMEELSEKIYRPAGNVTPRRWFSAEQLSAGAELIKAAEVRAEEIEAEEAAREKAEEIKIEEAILSSDSYDGTAKEVDTTIEKLTEALE
ncbi:MAG: hypothetical protein ACOX6B_05940 [Thermoguttaceae bacterium]